MKPPVHYLTLILLPVFICLSAQAQKRVLIVGEDWPPFEFYAGNEVVGINADIIKEIFTKHKIPYEIKLFPFVRAIHMLKEGQADAVLSTSMNEKRKAFLTYPKEGELWTSRFTLFYNKFRGIKNLKNFEEAKEKNYTIGIVKANSYHPSFWKVFPKKVNGEPNPQLIEVPYFDQTFKMLNANRIDLTLSEVTIGKYTAQLLDFPAIKASKHVMYEKKYFLPFAKKSKHPDKEKIQEIFQKELKLMKEDGRYEAIYKRWLEE